METIQQEHKHKPVRTTFYLDAKHDHFYVKNGQLYEVIKTLNGTKTRHRLTVNGTPDMERLSNKQIKAVEDRYLL